MKTFKRYCVVAGLAFLLLALSLPSDLSLEQSAGAHAQTNSLAKLSPDLRTLTLQEPTSERVNAIVQFNTGDRSLIDSLLQGFGAHLLRRFHHLNARVVSLPLSDLAALAERGEVRYISLDKTIFAAGHLSTTTGAEEVRVQTVLSLLGLPLTTTLDGTGLGIAILDSGIDAHHTSFRNALGLSRIVAQQDFTGEDRTDDPYGHGTHVASAAAGSGQASDNAYVGIAPNAHLINLRVLDSQGAGTTAGLLNALDWVLAHRLLYNIRVVNLSLGAEAIDSYANDPICQAVRRLSDAGVVVVAAAGNNGKDDNNTKIYGRIHSPGNEPSAITVGAANSYGTDSRADDGVTTYSSRGPTRSFWTDAGGVKHYDNLMKPDLVAPGNRVVWAQALNNHIVTTHPELAANASATDNRKMMYLSGSSMSAPVVAGAAALLLQLKPSLTPNMVKLLLMYTAQPLAGFNHLEQGAGQLNLEGAVRLARLMRSATASSGETGDALLSDDVPPVPSTTLANHTFQWAQGIILNHAAATGLDLITHYQGVYDEGRVLGDGVVETFESQEVNLELMTAGVALSSSILVSDGTSLGGGAFFMNNSLLLGNGIIIGDGIVIGDGIIIGDGIVIGDGIIVGDARLQALAAMINGDATPFMR